MKFEGPTRSTHSLSNFWNPTSPQTSDLPSCRTSSSSSSPSLPPYRQHLCSLNSPSLSSPLPSTSLKPCRNSLKTIHLVLIYAICSRTLQGELMSPQTHSQSYRSHCIVRDKSVFVCCLIPPFTFLSSSYPTFKRLSTSILHSVQPQ